MDLVIQVIVVIFACVLFAFATSLFRKKATTAATSAMTFVFLFIIVLSVSKFRHFNGWGFEAETWDQKQIEAAVLVDRLKSMTEATSGQVALLASKLGLWESGLSNPQLADLLKQTRQILDQAEVAGSEQEVILEPLYNRITTNYASAAYALVDRALAQRLSSLQAERSAAITAQKADYVSKLTQEIAAADKELQELRSGQLSYMNPTGIGALIAKLKTTSSLAGNTNLLDELTNIQIDVAFFESNRTLRRRIDWAYVYQ